MNLWNRSVVCHRLGLCPKMSIKNLSVKNIIGKSVDVDCRQQKSPQQNQGTIICKLQKKGRACKESHKKVPTTKIERKVHLL